MRVSLGMAHIHEQGPESPEHLHAERAQELIHPAPEPVERNGIARVAAGMALIAFLFGWIPIGGMVFGFLFGIPAVVLGAIALSRARQLGGWSPAIFAVVVGLAVVAWKLTPGIRMY
jgi:hypothetical protein